jgi:hypothetical protein
MKRTMEDYRVVSDGEVFRVQLRERILFFNSWFDVTNNLKTREEAEKWADHFAKVFGTKGKFRPV